VTKLTWRKSVKAHIKPNPNMTIEVEGKNQKELFTEMSSVYEIFGETSCGKCGSKNIKPIVRVSQDSKKKKDFDYFEWHCMEPSCLARLSLGQSNDQESLFPVRKLDKDGKPDWQNGKWDNRHRGWNDSHKKFSKTNKENE
jgi:hypothetical protein